VRGQLAALRERNLFLLVSAGTVNALGSGIAQVALAFAVLRIGSASDLGFVLLAREIPMVLFLLAGGVWADRVSRKHLLVWGATLQGVAQTATALLFLTHHAQIWVVALLQIVFGVAAAFIRPASTGLVPQAVSAGNLQAANALVDLSRSTSRIAGPAIGGVIVAIANPGWALTVDAVTFFVAAAMMMPMRVAPGALRERQRMLHELREGWSEFIARSWVWSMVAGFGIFQLTLFPAMLVLGPVVAKQHLGGPGPWGLILAFQAAGAVLGGLWAMHARPSRPLVAAIMVVLPVAAELALLGAAAPVWALCAVGTLAFAGLACSDVFWLTAFQQRIPEHLMSRLSSFDWLGSVALNPIGYALVGPLAGVIGIPATLYGAACANALVCFAVLLAPGVRGMRPLEAV
jgi:MFS family permease